MVRFRSFRHERLWVGNVVGIGNASGFVEPLEATALQVICVQSSTLADVTEGRAAGANAIDDRVYNTYNTEQWDDIRDFLAVHYKFNTRLDTPFWRACRADIPLGSAEPIVEFYRENGPSALLTGILIHPTNSFGLEGYLAMLVGQQVPHGKVYQAPPDELRAWSERCGNYARQAQASMSVEECLGKLRQARWMKALRCLSLQPQARLW